MKTQTEEFCSYEFAFPEIDTLAAVESTEDEIVIHTSRDKFSKERKTAFVHELAREGFIRESYLWGGRVRWLVDPAWWEPSPETKARTFRFMTKLLASTALFWLVTMGTLFWWAASSPGMQSITHSVNADVRASASQVQR
jgi:hypothetical protein